MDGVLPSSHIHHIKTYKQSFQDRIQQVLGNSPKRQIGWLPHGRSRRAAHFSEIVFFNRNPLDSCSWHLKPFPHVTQKSSCANGPDAWMCARFTTRPRTGSSHQRNVDQHVRVSERHLQRLGQELGGLASKHGHLADRNVVSILWLLAPRRPPSRRHNASETATVTGRKRQSFRWRSKRKQNVFRPQEFGVKMRTVFDRVFLER